MQNEILREAKSLYKIGFGVHALRAKSKAPLRSKWNGPERDAIDLVLKDLEADSNRGLGVRLGTPSRFKDGTYLAVIDVDIKGGEKYAAEALAIVDREFPGVLEHAPSVRSGRGYHYYVKVASALPSKRITSSPVKVKIKMNGEEVLRPAYEVEFMCAGKQVVLPPTRHPDTGGQYEWVKSFDSTQPPLVVLNDNNHRERTENVGNHLPNTGFEPVLVTLDNSPLPKAIVKLIKEGTDEAGHAVDRSAALMSVALHMARAKYSWQEFASVLLNRENALSEAVFERRNTKEKASEWLFKYCWQPAVLKVDPKHIFSDGELNPPLSVTEGVAQKAALMEMTDWQEKLDRSGKHGEGPPKATVENIVVILQNAVSMDVFKRDIFSFRDVLGCDTPWGGKKGDRFSNDDCSQIIFWLGQKFRFEPALDKVLHAATVIACQNKFHPVRDWLESLPLWDGKPRLATWLHDCFGAKMNPSYLDQVFTKWMVAMVWRVYEPLKFDWMPIFEGPQGVGKSSFGRILVGDEYFADWLPDLKDKDAAQGLQGNWAIEIAETPITKKDVNGQKAFLARIVDKYRPPYKGLWVDLPRQCVFYGTTNASEYLKDDTGNRRFKPVMVGQLDFKALRRDREHLFAEALFIYKNGLENVESLKDVTGSAKAYEATIHVEKTVTDESDLMLEILAEFFEKERKKVDAEKALNLANFSLKTLFDFGGPLSENWTFGDKNAKFAAKALRKLGSQKWKHHGVYRWKI